MGNFQNLTSSIKKYVDTNINKKADSNHDHINYAKKSDLSTVATSGSYNDLSDLPTFATEDFVNEAISNISSSSASSYKKFTIISSQWEFDNTYKLYTLNLTHSLNSNDVIVNSRNSSTGYNMIISSICIDQDTVKIYNDDNPDCTITVISMQYKPISDSDVANKQYVDDAINNAALGNIKLAAVATSGSYEDLLNKPEIPVLSTVAKTGNYNDLTNRPVIPSIKGLATETYVNNAINEAKLSTPDIDLSIYAKTSDLSNVATSGSYNDLTNKPTIPTVSIVGKTGNYNDLINKPNIPSIDGLATEKFVTEAISKIDINSSNASSYKKFTITSSQWTFDSNYNLYKLDLNHNLESKDIIVNSRNSSTGYSIILSSVCVDNNNITIYNDDNPDCTITAISMQYKPISDTDIANKEYVDTSIANATLGNIKLATVATTGSYNDLSDKPNIPTLPTLSNVATSGSYNDLIDKPTIPSIDGLASETYVNNKFDSINLDPYVLSSSLSTVATSGSYNDLNNKPTIPSIDGLATETYVNNKVDSIDLSIYVLTSSISTVGKTGLYNDLINKPIIPSIDGLASTTYVDNKFSSIDLTAYVLNSSLSTVAISGSYNDLNDKPTIITMDEVKAYVDEQIQAQITTALEGEY